MRYNVSPQKNKNFYNFPINKLSIAEILKGPQSPADRYESTPEIWLNQPFTNY